MLKKILWVLVIAFIVIQFFRPTKNISTAEQTNSFFTAYQTPADVKSILDKACLDCHSNNTSYPWYANLQPVAWFLDRHVRDGKKELNFDEYTNRNLRFQYHKMEEVVEQVEDGKMPLNSYIMIHRDAKLTDAEKQKLIDWANSVMDALKARHPIDSLIRKK
jgi:hypothetical protein